MKMNSENPLSIENICESLLKKGLISIDQKEAILHKKTAFHENFARTGSVNPAA